jgi:twitching motility protein PilJ
LVLLKVFNVVSSYHKIADRNYPMTIVTSKKNSKNQNQQQPPDRSTENIQNQTSKAQRTNLRKRILQTIIPAVVIPLAIAFGLGRHAIHQSAEEGVKQQLSNQNLLAGEEASHLLEHRLQSVTAIAQNTLIIDAARNSGQKSQIQQLDKLPIELVEKRFAKTKLTQPNQSLNDYLRRVAKTLKMAEIIVTDRHGFNVAYDRLTSDFVQKDESWWQEGKNKNSWIDSPAFDRSSDTFGFNLVQAIKDPSTGEFLGVVKAVLPFEQIEALKQLTQYNSLPESMQLQFIEPKTGQALQTFTSKDTSKTTDLIGGEIIASVASLLSQALEDKSLTKEKITEQLSNNSSLEEVSVNIKNNLNGKKIVSAYFIYRDREYSLSSLAGNNLIVSTSLSHGDVESAGMEWLGILGITVATLGGVTIATTLWLARQLSKPLANLASTVEQAASGNLDIVAQPSGTIETQIIAENFNKLVGQVKNLIQEQNNSLEELEQSRQQAEILAEEQKQKSENIQRELLNLLGDVEGASIGDLTVRSQISAGEIGIVADFFNAIVESLRDIVIRVKLAATQVNSLVGKNQDEMSQLATESILQAHQIVQTLGAVEQMGQSVQEVANNARIAAEVSRDASSVAEEGGAAMEKTFASILQLRETVAETTKKVKRLGESSQQISKIISLINQIAMQTNLLAINASIEAARAGEEGRGFAVVAEEVGELAAQSAEATKEIEAVVENIQRETAAVVRAMEIGTAQVVEGTHLVEDTKKNLEQIVAVSLQIDRLLQSISSATVSQAQTSQIVTNLMQEVANGSERTSDASQKVADSLNETVKIAQQLQASVETFKVEPEN